MNKIILGCLLLTAACSTKKIAEKTTDYFPKMNGCFLLYNVETNAFEKVIGEENCKIAYPACSTFKVPLAAMAFDSKVLKDENVNLKWDGKKDEREVSNQDHNAKTWMSNSIVWFSQRLTPKIGEKKLKKYLKDFEYGNQDLKGGLTQAWLVSPSSTGPALKINAYEQVEFMKKLWTNTLPVSNRAMKITRDITFLENSEKGFILYGKTGSNFYEDRSKRLGWFIAHIEGNDKEYIAVTNFSDAEASSDTAYGGFKAKEITKKILADEGLW